MGEKKIRELIQASSNITGGIAGAALGLLGPAGAFAGAFAGPVLSTFLQKVGTDVYDRKMSTREKQRIGSVFTYATLQIDKKIKDGCKIREDQFFTKHEDDFSDADEILENILLTAQKEHEEKKIIYYSNLIADFAFDIYVNKSLANNLIKIAQQLSYTQLCLLKIFCNREKYGLRNSDYSRETEFTYDLLDILNQIYDLGRLCVIGRENGLIIDLHHIYPTQLIPLEIGILLYQKMSLKDIAEEDIIKIVNIIK